MTHLKPLPRASWRVFVAAVFFSAWVAWVVSSSGVLLAQERSGVVNPVETWIDGLGADDYLMRLKSEDEILRIGSNAIDAVGRATESNDIEIRIRANRLLLDLLDQDFQNRKNAFLAGDPSDRQDFGFPQWHSFLAIVGESVESRKLFIDIIEHRRATSAGRGQAGAFDHFGYFADSNEPYTPLPSTAIEIADELFFQISSAPMAKEPAQQPVKESVKESVDQSIVIEQLTLSGFEQNLPATMVSIVNQSRHANEIKQLIKHWIVTRQRGDRLTSNQIEIIFRFELSGFANELATVLRAQGSQRRVAAAEAIAKTGGSDAVSVLRQFVNDQEVVVVYPQADLGTALPITIGDVAFQLILSLQDVPQKDFGLLPTAGTMLLSDTPVFGFADRVAAETAIGRWQSNQR